VWGGSYWTASLQYRALRAGARLTRHIGRADGALEYESHASLILDYLQTFWNDEEGYMSETTVTDVQKGGRSGKGSVPLSVTVLNFDPSLGCDSATFQPCSDRALSSLKILGDAFKVIFPITERLPHDQPSALLGAFYEEQIFGGHAHYFATLHASEQLFDALMTWDLLGELQITNLSLKFFRQFDQSVKTGTYKKGSEVYEGLTYALTSWAERTLLFLAEYMPEDYVLTMAIDRTTGLPVGPRGTIHCVVAAITVYDAYNGLIPPSWAHSASSRFSSKHLWNDTLVDDYNVGLGDEAGIGGQVHIGFQV